MPSPLVTLDRVDVRLSGATLLEDVSLEVRAGEGLGLVGPSGSGKSTLLRLLRGELWPHPASAGRRLFHDAEGASESPIGVRRRFSLVAPEQQDAYVRRDWDLPAEAVVRSGFEGVIGLDFEPTVAQRAAAAAALSRLGIAHLAERHLLTLSYGELRKVLLARALAPAPEVLLLDEPLAGLDPASRAWILSAVEEACARGAALVAVTHHADELPGAMHRRLALEGGRLRAG